MSNLVKEDFMAPVETAAANVNAPDLQLEEPWNVTVGDPGKEVCGDIITKVVALRNITPLANGNSCADLVLENGELLTRMVGDPPISVVSGSGYSHCCDGYKDEVEGDVRVMTAAFNHTTMLLPLATMRIKAKVSRPVTEEERLLEDMHNQLTTGELGNMTLLFVNPDVVRGLMQSEAGKTLQADHDFSREDFESWLIDENEEFS